MADPPVKMGGFKLSLAGAKNKAAPKKATSHLAKRPKLDLGDEEPEDTNTKQEISGFDIAQGGAVELNGKKKEEKTVRVIAAQANKNWREEARRRHAERTGHGVQVGEEKEVVGLQYGLTIVKKDAVEETDGDAVMEDVAPVVVDDGLTDEQRLEKRAVDALLNDKAPADITTIAMSEEAVFAKELAEAPDAPTLSAYEATPIDGFGAALLRGMGWKDGEELGRNKGAAVKPREVKPRPALLGIGAKAEAEVGLETVWEKGKPKRKTAQTYNPVALRNKKTGELVTEEELKERLERQKLDEERERKESRMKTFELEDEPREKKSRAPDRKKDDRRRDKDEQDDYRSDRKLKDRARDDRRDDDVDDRRREKRRDRRERSYSPDSRSKDKRRERSRSPEDRRSKDRRRERERSRSRDSKDRRREKERRDGSRDRHRDSDDGRKRRREYDDEREERKRRYRDERSRR
jgi:hypothetical protein